MAWSCVVSVAAFYAISLVVLRVTGQDRRAFLNAMVYANVGNMGLPLCLLAFGDQGLALGIAYFSVNVVLLFSAGVAVAAGATSVGILLRLPILYAVAASLLVIYAGVETPKWVLSTTDLLGGLTVPLMLIALGVSLADLAVKDLRRSVALSVFRIAMGIAVGVATAEVLGMEGMARGVVILQCAMPVAVFNYLFAARYDTRPAEVAGTVVVSTVMSFLTLPALLLYIL